MISVCAIASPRASNEATHFAPLRAISAKLYFVSATIAGHAEHVAMILTPLRGTLAAHTSYRTLSRELEKKRAERRAPSAEGELAALLQIECVDMPIFDRLAVVRDFVRGIHLHRLARLALICAHKLTRFAQLALASLNEPLRLTLASGKLTRTPEKVAGQTYSRAYSERLRFFTHETYSGAALSPLIQLIGRYRVNLRRIVSDMRSRKRGSALRGLKMCLDSACQCHAVGHAARTGAHVGRCPTRVRNALASAEGGDDVRDDGGVLCHVDKSIGRYRVNLRRNQRGSGAALANE
jgi:hypothetical protein